MDLEFPPLSAEVFLRWNSCDDLYFFNFHVLESRISNFQVSANVSAFLDSNDIIFLDEARKNLFLIYSKNINELMGVTLKVSKQNLKENSECIFLSVLEQMNQLFIPLSLQNLSNSSTSITHSFVSMIKQVQILGWNTSRDTILQETAFKLDLHPLPHPKSTVGSISISPFKMDIWHTHFSHPLSQVNVEIEGSTSGEFSSFLNAYVETTELGRLFLDQKWSALQEYWSGKGSFYVTGSTESLNKSILGYVLQDCTVVVTEEKRIEDTPSAVNYFTVNVSGDDVTQGYSSIVKLDISLKSFVFSKISYFPHHTLSIQIPSMDLYFEMDDFDHSNKEEFGWIDFDTCTYYLCFDHCDGNFQSICNAAVYLYNNSEVSNQDISSAISSLLSREHSVLFGLISEEIPLLNPKLSFPQLKTNSESEVILNAVLHLANSNSKLMEIPCLFLPGTLCPYNVSLENSIGFIFDTREIVLRLPIFASFPVSLTFESPIVLAVDFEHFTEFAVVSFHQLDLFWKEDGLAYANSTIHADLIDLQNTQRVIDIFKTSKTQSKLRVRGSSRNLISYYFSKCAFEHEVGPTSKSTLAYFLTETNEEFAFVSVELPLHNAMNITLDLGNFHVDTYFDGIQFGSVESHILIHPGENIILFNLSIYGQTVIDSKCQDWYIDDKRFCQLNRLLNEVINQTHVIGAEIIYEGFFENFLHKKQDVLGHLVISQTENTLSKKEDPQNIDEEEFSFEGLIKVKSFSYFQTISKFIFSAIRDSAYFEGKVNLLVTNIFNVSVTVYSYAIDVYLVDKDATPPYWFFMNRVYPPDPNFLLVKNVSQELNGLKLQPGNNATVTVTIPIYFSGISEKMIRLYDELVVFNRFCVNLRNIQVKLGIQAESSQVFNATVAVSYEGASLKGDDDCSLIFKCNPSKQTFLNFTALTNVSEDLFSINGGDLFVTLYAFCAYISLCRILLY